MGLPVWVEPIGTSSWSKCSAILSRMRTALSGKAPPFKPFDTVIMSGTTPQCSIPNHLPVRPKPVITSSAISRIPYLSQISRSIP